MSKNSGSMGHRKRAILTHLFDLHRATCTRCGCAVMMVHEALAAGWTDTGVYVVSPDKSTAVRHATIEHITPRCQGGSDDYDNLTLFCSVCNGETNPQPRAKERVHVPSHVGPRLVKFSHLILPPLTESKGEAD